LKHIDGSADAFIYRINAKDNDAAMVFASPKKLEKVGRRRRLSINDKATPITVPLYVRDKRNVVAMTFGARPSAQLMWSQSQIQ
jgi:hypothetical protein